jgi:hypothetical protein
VPDVGNAGRNRAGRRENETLETGRLTDGETLER